MTITAVGLFWLIGIDGTGSGSSTVTGIVALILLLLGGGGSVASLVVSIEALYHHSRAAFASLIVSIFGLGLAILRVTLPAFEIHLHQ